MAATRTYAVVEVPRDTFKLIKAKLQEAGYYYAVRSKEDDQPLLDMDGIAIVEEVEVRE